MSGLLVNAHTHVYSGLAPLGVPPPEPAPRSFLEILERVWWRLDRAIDEATLRASARYYVANALLAGTTTLIDHHESPGFIEGSLDVLADACQELGMRAVLCYGATERNGGAEEARRGLAECRRFILGNRRPLVRGIVGLHASFTVSDDTIRAAGDLCRELGTVVHVHVAEDLADVADAQARGHAGPLQRLVALDCLPPGSILAHGVHLRADEIRTASAYGCWLVQNARSNRHNQVGYPRTLRHAQRVALGTDGFPSDMVDELDVMRVCAEGHLDDHAHAERRLPAGAALAASLFGESAVEPVAADSPGFDGREWALSQRRCVTAAWSVDGRGVIHDGHLLTGDLDEIRADADVQAQRLWARMRALG
jgi:cytosine/adenosine deaminase-related metal-dependent hydrolase